MISPDIYVVIATSYNRTDWLIERSLVSAYRQVDIDSKRIQVLVVDDNPDPGFKNEINRGIELLRSNLKLSPGEFETGVIANAHTF